MMIMMGVKMNVVMIAMVMMMMVMMAITTVKLTIVIRVYLPLEQIFNR